MRTVLALSVALAMLANGCASVRVVDPHAPGKVLRELNASAEGKLVRVALRGGQRFSGTDIHAASDSTTWFDAGDRRVAVSTAEIVKVDVIGGRRRGGNVVRGALLGSIPGGILVVSALTSEEQGDVDLTGAFGIVALVGGALLGAALGFVSGAEEETTTTYILNEASAGFLLEDTP
jgi:hypothetical protein